MGIPEHFSHDIAQRCRFLIQELQPRLDELKSDKFGGPLRTTFLLAMATPMIVLPVDRIFQPGQGRVRVADDTFLSPDLAQHVKNALGDEQVFATAPFFETGSWRYVADHPPFNVAEGLPDELQEHLSTENAIQSAREASTKSIIVDLRNALAHGGVAYLDRYGRTAEREAAMLAFVAKKSQKSENLNVLRIHEVAFRSFLMAWADWLCEGVGLERKYNTQAA